MRDELSPTFIALKQVSNLRSLQPIFITKLRSATDFQSQLYDPSTTFISNYDLRSVDIRSLVRMDRIKIESKCFEMTVCEDEFDDENEWAHVVCVLKCMLIRIASFTIQACLINSLKHVYDSHVLSE